MSDESEQRQSVEQRIEYLQSQALAHSMVLKALVPALLPDGATRAIMRERICNALEKMYEEQGLRTDAHFTLQAALDEVEGLFTMSADSDRMTNLQR